MEWEGDVLGRKEDALFLTNYLTKMYQESKKKYFILNVNSPWGFGKTYFLKNWKSLLEKKHPVIYYDAWMNDFTSEPLLSFVATIEEQIAEYLTGKNEKTRVEEFAEYAKKLVKPTLPIMLSILVKQLTGMSPEYIAKAMEDAKDDIGGLAVRAADEALKDYSERKKSVAGFKEKLSSIVKAVDKKQSLGNPIFIFVDELDRCRPTFAIELLEAIKHLFDVDGIYFVIATDSIQLAHSIKAVYGSEFDSVRYLKRFFDREYSFDKPDHTSFVRANMAIYSLNDNVVFPVSQDGDDGVVLMSKIFSLYKASLRDVEQCMSHLQACSLTAEEGEVLHGVYLLHLICFKHIHPEKFRRGVGIPAFEEPVFNTSELVSVMQFGDDFERPRISYMPVSDLIAMYHDRLFDGLSDIALYEPGNDLAQSVRDQLIAPSRGRGRAKKHNMERYWEMVERSGKING
jgi:hypothetical protein